MSISLVATSSNTAAPSDSGRAFVQPPPAATVSEAQKPAATGAGVGAQAPSPEQIAQAVKQVNAAFTQKEQNLYASIERDKATGIDVVKFQDANTKEVISQYPSKAIIAIAEALGQSQEAKGRLINISA